MLENNFKLYAVSAIVCTGCSVCTRCSNAIICICCMSTALCKTIFMLTWLVLATYRLQVYRCLLKKFLLTIFVEGVVYP